MPEARPPGNDEYYMGIAFAVRERANCLGNRVGAVIVKGNRVISTGYNGVPEGMTNCLDGGCLRCRPVWRVRRWVCAGSRFRHLSGWRARHRPRRGC